RAVGSFWYTCWVDAGQPDIFSLINPKDLEGSQQELEEDNRQNPDKIKSRPHESSIHKVEKNCTHICCHSEHVFWEALGPK
ncbi:MAG: hypothetical protein K2Q22_03650, partial [Cytophagales bacterium]|nr:hypothetical protein [Cytophagales bacterium]